MTKKIIEKINRNRKGILVFALLLVLLNVIIVPRAQAVEWKQGIAIALGWIVAYIVNALGMLLKYLMMALKEIAAYNDFIEASAVTTGWVIVRDFSNMFFIVILLLIAFGTILRRNDYSIKLLPKLILMAVLINFSKTICGLMIDVAQVVMLTFVKGFSTMGDGNLATLLGINKLFEFQPTESGAELTGIIGSYIMALIFVLISIVVVVVILAVLAIRIAMIWIYVTISPIAFLLEAFPQGKKYANQWWSEFTNYLIVGPVLAFFLWLALATASADIGGKNTAYDAASGQAVVENYMGKESMIKFFISIALLMGGLKISSSFAGAASGAIGKGMGAIQSGKNWSLNKAKGATVWTAKKTSQVGLGAAATAGGFADRSLGRGIDAVSKLVKLETNFGTKGLVKKTAADIKNTPGNLLNNVKNRFGKDDALNQARRDAKDRADGKLSYEGKEYKLNDDGYYQEIGEDGEVNTAGALLQNSNKKPVKKMGGLRAARYDTWGSVRGGARAVNMKAEEEKAEKYIKEAKAQDLSSGELLRRFNDKATSVHEKRAYANMLAERGDFNNAQEVEAAKKAMGSNSIMAEKFNDSIDKTQAHLAYDLSVDPTTGKYKNEADVDSFHRRIDSGKIDSTKLDSSAYQEPGVMKALQDFHGKDFSRVAETAFKRGKKYEKTVADGLLKSRDMAKLDDDKSAKTHAKLTGEVGAAFAKVDAKGNPIMNSNGYPEIDINAAKQYFSTAKAADINKMSTKELDKLINEHGMGEKDIAESIGASKLKSIYVNGDNPELARRLKYIIETHGLPKDKAAIFKDPQLLAL